MLEIIALYFLTKRTRGIVENKGYKPGKWQVYTVLIWIASEFIGMMFSFAFFNSDTIIAVFSGLLTAIGTAIIFQKRIENLPDINTGNDDWLNNIGNDSNNS